jgi:hypothetical protein
MLATGSAGRGAPHWRCNVLETPDGLEALAEPGQGAEGALAGGQGLHTVA